MNILFTCAGRRVGLMDAFRLAMAELGLRGKIVATDVTTASAAFVKADVGVLVPSVGTNHYIASLMDIVAQHKIGLLIPVTDLDLQILAQHRDEFAAAGCTVMVGSQQSVRLCRDKIRTNELLAKIGLPSIRSCDLAGFRREPFYPCFVKPVGGSAGVGSAVIKNGRELDAHIATFGEKLLVQEYVPGQEFTIDVFRTRAGEVRCVVPRQRLAVRSGEVEKGITVRDEALIEATIKLAGSLGDIWGAFCCQCRRSLSTQGAKGSGHEFQPAQFFEVNPRFGGGSLLSIAAGANLPLYVLQEVLGLEVTAKLGQFTDQLLMLRYDQAVFVPVADRRTLPGFDTPTFR